MTGFSNGFFLGWSLIIAIGAQNAFVIRQGLQGRHVGPVVLFCSLSDALCGFAVFGSVFMAGGIRSITAVCKLESIQRDDHRGPTAT